MSPDHQDGQRYLELDFLRVLALFFMIAYHAAYDWQYFFGHDVHLEGIFWTAIGRVSALTFLALVGVSGAISWDRRRSMMHAFSRAMRIGGAAIVVTIATWIVDPATFVRFGILHLIAVSVLLVVPLRWSGASLAAVLLAIGMAWYVPLPFSLPYLGVPLGIGFRNIVAVDYYPLVPWIGVVFLGRWIGDSIYVQHRSWRAFLPSLPSEVHWFRRSIERVSRRSLLLYMVHQPVLLGILSLFDSVVR